MFTSLGRPIDYSCSSATNPVFCAPFPAVFVGVFLKSKIVVHTNHNVTRVRGLISNTRSYIGKQSKSPNMSFIVGWKFRKMNYNALTIVTSITPQLLKFKLRSIEK